MKDLFGNTIRVGDYIAYPGRSGSSLWTTIGRVTRIEDGKVFMVSASPWLGNRWSKASNTHTAHTDRAVILGCSVPDEVKTLLD